MSRQIRKSTEIDPKPKNSTDNSNKRSRWSSADASGRSLEGVRAPVPPSGISADTPKARRAIIRTPSDQEVPNSKKVYGSSSHASDPVKDPGSSSSAGNKGQKKPFPENGAEAMHILKKWRSRGLFSLAPVGLTNKPPEKLYAKFLEVCPQKPLLSKLRTFQAQAIWREFFACIDALASVDEVPHTSELASVAESLHALRPYNFDLKLADMAFAHLKEKRVSSIQVSIENVGQMTSSVDEVTAAEEALGKLGTRIEKLKGELKLLEDEYSQKKEELEETIQNEEAFKQQESETQALEGELDTLNALDIGISLNN